MSVRLYKKSKLIACVFVCDSIECDSKVNAIDDLEVLAYNGSVCQLSDSMCDLQAFEKLGSSFAV